MRSKEVESYLRDRSRIKANILYYMALKNVNQEKMAQKLIMSPSTFSRRLSNVDTFTLAELNRISSVLGIKRNELLEGKMGVNQ